MPESSKGSNGTLDPGATFATTQWTRVLLARDPNSAEGQDALAGLCREYWYPLYAYVRRTGQSAEDTQDLVQEFFSRLLEKEWLRQADPARGKFRSFLLGAMKHFLANEWDKARAAKRGGRLQIISLDQESAETRYRAEPSHTDTPDKIFERRWAMMLLEKVLGRLRNEHASEQKRRLFEELKNCLAGSRESLPYAEIGTRLGLSEGAVKVAVSRFRQRYRELLRDEIGQTVSEPAQIDEELQHLIVSLRS